MSNVLKEKNQVILWTDDLLFFEWKISLSNSIKSTIAGEWFYSSFFKLGGREKSRLMFLWKKRNRKSILYLSSVGLLHSRKLGISISDHNRSVVWNVNAYTDDLYHRDLTSAIEVEINFLPLTLFPLTITGLIHNSTITPRCKQPQTTEKSTITEELHSIDFTSMARGTELSVDFKKLLYSPVYSDIDFNVEDVSIEAHKNVLHARSPLLQKMLSHDTTEDDEITIVVADISAAVMKILVAYLYTGIKEKCSFEECCDLYYAAKKYEVLSLQEACRVELLNHLKVDNAYTLLGLAKRHRDEIFSKKVMQFMHDNDKYVVKPK